MQLRSFGSGVYSCSVHIIMLTMKCCWVHASKFILHVASAQRESAVPSMYGIIATWRSKESLVLLHLFVFVAHI